MKFVRYITLIVLGILLAPGQLVAQEEESAEISLEGASDTFQERFFEALKEKAIENYEKAIDLLMECKTLAPDNRVVDYELGKNHAALRQYAQAERYLKNAVDSDPENIWYLEALFTLYRNQRNETEAVRLGEQLAQKHHKYKETLTRLYARYRNYEKAIQLLDELDETLGASTQRQRRRAQYQAMLNSKRSSEKAAAKKETTTTVTPNPLETIQSRITTYQSAADYNGLLGYINEVLETYPSQSRFYYVKGKTLNQLQKHTEAAAVLRTALDFLVDDTALQNNIYEELVLAYKALGNAGKVREYSKKIKSKA